MENSTEKSRSKNDGLECFLMGVTQIGLFVCIGGDCCKGFNDNCTLDCYHYCSA